METELTGVVVARYRRHVAVLGPEGEEVYLCQTAKRGLHPLTGDEVRWRPDGERTGVVTAVLTRRSALTRTDSRGRREVVAANLTQLLVVAAPEPPPDWFMVDRYTAAAELGDMTCGVVFNKIDLLSGRLPAELEVYERIGYRVHRSSAVTGEGVQALAAAMAGERSALVGLSGVGKSSLINALAGDTLQAVRELSAKGRHGRHTTTTAVLHRLPMGGELVDSPGVRNYAPYVEEPAALARGFREFREHLGRCRFDDCRHVAEPDCAVKRAVAQGAIDARRYESYVRLLTLSEKHRG